MAKEVIFVIDCLPSLYKWSARMRVLTCITILLCAALIESRCHKEPDNKPTDYKLTVLHTNDVHSRIDEAHKYGGTCSSEQSADGDCVGGSSRLWVLTNHWFIMFFTS